MTGCYCAVPKLDPYIVEYQKRRINILEYQKLTLPYGSLKSSSAYSHSKQNQCIVFHKERTRDACMKKSNMFLLTLLYHQRLHLKSSQ